MKYTFDLNQIKEMRVNVRAVERDDVKRKKLYPIDVVKFSLKMGTAIFMEAKFIQLDEDEMQDYITILDILNTK